VIFGAKLLRKELVSFVCNFVRSSDIPCGSQHGASSRPPVLHWPHSGEGGPWVCVVFEATLWPPFPATQLFSWLCTLMKPNYLLKNDVAIAPICVCVWNGLNGFLALDVNLRQETEVDQPKTCIEKQLSLNI
jgi:hypothetical protein